MTKIQKFNPNTPIYQQIVDDIIKDLITGEIKPESKLLSVRELAIVYKVNPNTIQNVVKELVELKVVEVIKNVGLFSKSDKSIKSLREKIVKSEMEKFRIRCKELDIKKEEIQNIMEDLCLK